jgi:hypothetical protein
MKAKYLGKNLGRMTPEEYFFNLRQRGWEVKDALEMIIKTYSPSLWEQLKNLVCKQ